MASPFDLEEEKKAIAAALAGDDTKSAGGDDFERAALSELAAKRGDPGPQVSPAAASDVDAALARMRPATQAPAPELRERPVIPTTGRAPSAPSAGRIDPELAFMAAYSQNTQLAKMVEDQRNAPFKQAEEARQNAQDARAQQRWEMDRDIMSPLRAQAKRNENFVSGAKADVYRPDSNASKAARTAGAARLRADAQRVNNPEIQKLLTAHADYLESHPELSAMDVHQRLSKEELGGIGANAASDAFRAAQQSETSRMNDAKIGDMSEKNKIAWARINAARERASMPKQPSDRQKAAMVKDQGKLDDEIEKADWAKNMLLSVADLKQRVNTGPIAGRAQDMLQKVGLSSQDYDSMKSRLSTVTNRIIKELSGSAVTGNEWARMQDELSNIHDDDPNFETKLANMIELTEEIKKRAVNKYARSAGGEPMQQSNTAQRSTAGAPRVRQGETAPADITTRATGTGANAASKAAAAKAWLQANPNDPRAEAIRKRLQQMGAMQ